MRADLALIGFGNVGRRFARLMAETRQTLTDVYDLDVRVVSIATRTRGIACNGAGIDAVRAAEGCDEGVRLSDLPDAESTAGSYVDCIAALARSTADLRVVVETTTLAIRDGRPAIDHVEAGLRAGCHVVTANKGPAAFAYPRLHQLASAANLSFLFEGAVMDGIPVFNLVRETMPAVRVRGFRGVVNTTTNYILSMLETGHEFAPALAYMQSEGIAEADPSLDIDGWDAAAKAAALANVLLEAGVTPHDVERTGLGPDTALRARQAREHGRRLRLVASCRRGERPAVALRELPAEDLLAGLEGTANALILETDLLGELAITQLGGDLTQTAYALLSDLVTIRRRQRVPTRAPVDRNL